jgi:hypothetical protein
MISIIKKHPGMETIEIGNKEYSVSTIWLLELEKLLW